MKVVKTAIASACIALSMVAVAQDKEPEKHDLLRKEVLIMNKILQTSLQESDDRRHRGSIEGLYLMNQGVMFTVKGRPWRYGGSAGPLPPMPPLPPVPENIVYSSESMGVEVEEIELAALIEDRMGAAFSSWEHSMDEHTRMHEKASQLKEQSRSLNYDLRELDREVRELTIEKRVADSDRKKDIDQKIKDIKKRQESMIKEKERLKAEAKRIKQEAKVARQKQHKESIETRKAYMKRVTQTVSSTLCNYGGGLRHLNKNEHVSIVLPDLWRDDKTGGQSQILVFTKKDINQCVVGDINENELMSKVTQYRF